MGTLQPDEVEFISVMFAKSPMCPARGYSMEVMAGPTPEQQLDIELYLRQVSQPCKEIWALKRLWEDYRIRRRERDRRQRDPTIQETDRKNSTHNER